MTTEQRYRSLINEQNGQLTYSQVRQMLSEQGISHQTIPDTGKPVTVTDPDKFLAWLLN